MSEYEADALVQQAKNKQNSYSFMQWLYPSKSVTDIYLDAAKMYIDASQWRKAATAYSQAAFLDQSSNYYKLAAYYYKKNYEFDKYVINLERAITYEDYDLYKAKLYEELGNFYRSENQYDETIYNWLKSAKYYDQYYEVKQYLLIEQASDLMAFNGNYKDAIYHYNKIAKFDVQKRNQKMIIFKLCLCKIILKEKLPFDFYKELCYDFEDSFELLFVQCLSDDLDKKHKLIKQFETKIKFSKLHYKLLLEI